MLKRISPSMVGRWSGRHPWVAVGVWLAFVLAAVAAVAITGTRQLQNGAVGESARGYAVMDQHMLGFVPREYVYLHSASVGVSAPEFQRTANTLANELRHDLRGQVTLATAPNRHAMLIAAQATGPFSDAAIQRSIAADRARSPGIDVVSVTPNGGGNSDLSRAETLSVPVTLVVLLIAFGALVASLVPVLLAATAVVAAFGLLGPISHAFALDDSVKTVVLLIGMAVGVDYALFYVVRSREERRRGASTDEAVERAASTAGRSVLVAGLTVMVAMAGQFAVGSNVFNGIASGTIAVVACAVAGSVTVLPAVLGLLGPRIDRGRIPFLSRRRPETEPRLWGAIVERVLRRPMLSVVLAGGALVALAVPALGMHVSKPSSFALSSSGQSTLVAEVTSQFPAASVPAVVVATWPTGEQAATERAARRLAALAVRDGIAHPPLSATVGRDGRSLALALPAGGLGDNSASRHAVTVLRERLIPPTLGRMPGVRTAVTGDPAEDVDFTAQMRHGVPYVIAFVLALAFILLLVAFRSIVVPLKAIVLNLLSVGASYGVLVLVFQHRWAQGLLGFRSDGAIISWLPLFLFVVLFGLSMDYHVFILSRVREGVDSGLSTEEALRRGIIRTAGVVSSAALVMVAVFSLFATSSSLDLKQAGVGLAVAVLLDATVIRGVLLPATMKLLGERNWYLPRRLGWLPSGLVSEREPVPVLATGSD
jgi:putative drug exporter of the RND superfamily